LIFDTSDLPGELRVARCANGCVDSWLTQPGQMAAPSFKLRQVTLGNDDPHGFSLVSRSPIIDAGNQPAGVAPICNGGVSGRHSTVIPVGQNADTRGTEANSRGDAHATGTRADSARGDSPRSVSGPNSGAGPAAAAAGIPRKGIACCGEAEDNSKRKGRQTHGPVV
jgi:hypothetical protein